ncbi:secreted 45 kDa protein-like [Procambarus clarkii]|uniref:secreted 45 kDa protein-like n=1 Tax=Procambarus clarkii TaxID=6728 RepID=UPI003743A527
MMSVVMSVVMTAVLLVLAIVEAAPQSAASLGQSCPEFHSQVMSTLAQELCEETDTSKCTASMAKCLEYPRPAKPSNSTNWKQRMLANITTCANELDYSFTAPPTSQDNPKGGSGSSTSNTGSSTTGSSTTGNSITGSSTTGSSTTGSNCPHHFTLENYLKKLGFSQEELVPMTRCLMTRKGTLEKFGTCINQ